MSTQRLLTLTTMLVALSSASFAGGPDPMVMQTPPYTPNVYVDIQGGYSWQNWNTLIGELGTIWAIPGGMTSNEYGGFVGGMDAGLQLFQHIGIELGGFYMPKVVGDVVGQDVNIGGNGCDQDGCHKGHQWNWIAYAAGKFSLAVPYINKLNVFTKLGAAWRGMNNNKQSQIEYSGRFYNWEVMFGGGFEYILDQTGLRLGIQWLYLPKVSYPSTLDGSPPSLDKSAASDVARMQPAANILTASIGYQFSI